MVNLIAVSGPSIGGSLPLGFVARNADLVIAFASPRRLAAPLPTPFGDPWVQPDLLLPPVAVAGDDRAFLGVPIGFDPNLPGTRSTCRPP